MGNISIRQIIDSIFLSGGEIICKIAQNMGFYVFNTSVNFITMLQQTNIIMGISDLAGSMEKSRISITFKESGLFVLVLPKIV